MAELESKVIDDENDYQLDDSQLIKTPEYEKLLNLEANRQLNVKARNMVRLGLFEQENIKEIDFSTLSKVTYKKPYKGRYELYISSTGQLLYVYPKTESDSNKPYEFDVLKIETPTEEEYKEILKASNHEHEFFLKLSHYLTNVLLAVAYVLFIAVFAYYLIAGEAFTDLMASLINTIIFLGVFTGVKVLSTIAYRRFIN